MDELDEQRELDRLISEQEKDDSSVLFPEPGHEGDVGIEGLENALSMDEDGEVLSFVRRDKGEVLVGGATFHGTLYGARRLKCKCNRCRAAAAEYQRGLRAKKKEAAA